MENKSRRWLDQGISDFRSTVLWYRETAGSDLAERFARAVEAAASDISMFPALDSTRYAEYLRIPSLRSRAVADFPYLVFYIERESHIEIWRLLHTDRDVPELLR